MNEHLQFDLNFPAIVTGVYLLYYYTLEPVAAVRPNYLHSHFKLANVTTPTVPIYAAVDPIPADRDGLVSQQAERAICHRFAYHRLDRPVLRTRSR